MKLSKEDVKLFYKLNWSFLAYVNKKYAVINSLTLPDFSAQDLEKVLKLHEKAYSHPELMDSFVAENPQGFASEELDIIKSWKNFVKDSFFVVSYEKDYAVFLAPKKEPKAYGVVGLYDELEDIFGPYLPALSETFLLPFKGRIVPCGVFSSFNVHFGGGMRKTVQADLQKARSKFGIILSLETPVSERKEADEELLRFYARNEANREDYAYEIEKIVKKNTSLRKIYSQEIGKSNARKARKRLSELGVASGWFAIFEDTLIASGQTEEEVKAQVLRLLPEEKRERVHLFQYSKK